MNYHILIDGVEIACETPERVLALVAAINARPTVAVVRVPRELPPASDPVPPASAEAVKRREGILSALKRGVRAPSEIARQLQCSTQTIYNDLSVLRLKGLVVKKDDGWHIHTEEAEPNPLGGRDEWSRLKAGSKNS